MKKIQILGPGCLRCRELADLVAQAAKEMAFEHEIENVIDIRELVKYGVSVTPALVVDGELKMSGEVPSLEKVKELIS
jgi:small redox-active disulfide protein 2